MDVALLPARVLVRLAAVTSTVLALGAGAHLAAAGTQPDVRVLLVLTVATAVVATPLAHRRLRAATLLPVVGVWQWMLHLGLAAPTSGHDGPGTHLTPVGVVDHVHGTALVPGGAAGVLDAGTAAVPTGTVAPLIMTAAHVLATVLTVALLVATERATDRALRRLAWALPVLAGPRVPAPPAVRRVPVVAHVVAVDLPLHALRAHGCRAPPWAVLAA